MTLGRQGDGGRFMARVLAPVLLLFAVCARFVDDTRPGLNDWFLIFAGFEVGLVVSAVALLWPDRLRWARRAVVGILGAAYVAFAGKLAFLGAPGAAASSGAVFWFLIGVPAVIYGVTGGRIRDAAPLKFPSYPAPLTPAERRTAAARIVGRTLSAKLEWLLATNPHLRREGELSEEGWGVIRFPRVDEGGFDVSVLVAPGEVTVHAGELAHFHVGDADPDAEAAAALTCIRDLLGPDTRLRERVAGGRPYRARVEMRTPEGWRLVTVTGVLLWNFFAHRSERTLQNRSLSGRFGAA